ncbi:MAG: alpha/beta fold hydrolase [Pseudomonadota bacterium]
MQRLWRRGRVWRHRPRLHHFLSLGPSGFHRVAYTEWGNPRRADAVVCVHGLTRNSRDFDALAASLADRRRVVCMDVAGRGASDWLERKEDYSFALYQADAAALLARVTAPAPGRAARVDWVGTSMGGLIGMLLAAQPNSPIRRLVLNDVGPLVPWLALARLKGHAPAGAQRFADLDEVEAYLRRACASFGPLEDHHWRHLASHGAQLNDDGSYRLAFDPEAVSVLRRSAAQGLPLGPAWHLGIDLWRVWDAIRCPVLVLRGGESDLLPDSIAREMQVRGPGARVVEFPGVGHAPWLMSDDQVDVVQRFLLERDG